MHPHATTLRKKALLLLLLGERRRGEAGNLPDILVFNYFLLVLLSWRALLIILRQDARDLSF